MVDPRYRQHFAKVAKDKNVTVQELARLALYNFIPNPYESLTYVLDEEKTKKRVKK